MGKSVSLLSSTVRVEVPFIKVTIGKYTFGIYSAKQKLDAANNKLIEVGVQYPNYIQRLTINKINGRVNEYTLNLTYPISPGDDPNFFEKVFSSVSVTRKIVFSYGDLSVPDYYYKDEQAIITKIGTSFDLKGGRITYNVSAVSTGILSTALRKTYSAAHAKPSDLIFNLLQDKANGLGDLFYGLKPFLGDKQAFQNLGIIAGDDIEVDVLAKQNISPLDYLNYLVGCMIPKGVSNSTKTTGFYGLSIHDEAENTLEKGTYISGPYFKIKKVSKGTSHSDAYNVTIGYPSGNLITEFSYNQNENYSILFNYQNELKNNDYTFRVDPTTGNWIKKWAPAITSSYDTMEEKASDKVWWTKLTEYPVSATISLRGLLRPALLMEYLKLTVLFHGRPHIASGMYIITKQTDIIDGSGYRTTLELTRVDSVQWGDF